MHARSKNVNRFFVLDLEGKDMDGLMGNVD